LRDADRVDLSPEQQAWAAELEALILEHCEEMTEAPVVRPELSAEEEAIVARALPRVLAEKEALDRRLQEAEDDEERARIYAAEEKRSWQQIRGGIARIARMARPPRAAPTPIQRARRPRTRERRPQQRRQVARTTGPRGDPDEPPLDNGVLPPWAELACENGTFGFWHPGDAA
jgi:hypothetical protein